MIEKTFLTAPNGETYYFKDAGARQLIEGKADKSNAVSNISYDSTNKKITKTVNNTTSDVVTASTLKTDMALGNVENKSSSTIRSELTSDNVTTALGYTPLNPSLKGAANGLAELDSEGKVPSSQLPSYVDDVIEGYYYNSKFYTTDGHTVEIPGESGKIYIDLTNGSRKVYRWGGTAFAEIPIGLALGTSSSTAYRGDRGDSAYKHAVTNKGAAFANGFYKFATNAEGHVTAATVVDKSDITGLGIPAQDTTYSEATTSEAGLMSSADKTKLNNIATGATANIGTITGVTMNGESKGTSGVIDLGTVITDISDKADKSATVSNVSYDTTNKKLRKTINGTTLDIVTTSTLKSDMALNNVENKSSATIRGELTETDVTIALGYTPPTSDTTYVFDGTYDESINKAATVYTVTSAINALDGNLNNTTPGAEKTLVSFSQTDGRINATFDNISITKSQISDFPVLGTASAKNVTDNSKSTSVTSTDTNLITGRTLYYAGYTKNTGTVTSVGTGAGLTGGTITSSGTIKANLTSEAMLTNEAADAIETVDRVYPVRLDKNGKLAVNVPWTDTTNFVPTIRKVNGKALSADITLSASDVNAAPSTTVSCTKANIESALNVKASATARFYREDGTWQTPSGSGIGTVTSITAGTGLIGGTITSTGTIALDTSGATAGSYGPSANVTGDNNATMYVPYITVDEYGRITSIANKTYTAKNTTYSNATTSADGLMSSIDKTKLDGIAAGATANIGTITGITMNGSSVGTSGVIDLGTVITSHQDISGKKNVQTAVSDPAVSSGTSVTFISSITQNAQGVITPTKKKITTMTAATASASGAAGLVPEPAAGKQVYFLRGDATWAIPTDTTYSIATQSTNGLMSSSDKTKLDNITSISNAEIDNLF